VWADVTSAYSQEYGTDDDEGSRILYDEVTRSLYWDKTSDRVVVYDRIVGGEEATREQHVRDAPVVTRLYDQREGSTAELLMVVNGIGALALDPASIGIEDLVAFDRSNGDLR
jgi:hypothetical protein